MAERWGALPLGELHDEGRCALCGLRGEIGISLKRTVLVSTMAVAHVCIDSVVCECRRYNQRRRVA